MLLRGIKKQVFGGILFLLGVITALLARTIGFELDIFYVAISIIGAGLFLYGTIQKNRHKSTPVSQHDDGLCAEPDSTEGNESQSTNFTAGVNLASRAASTRQRV